MDQRSARTRGIALTERQKIAWLRLIRSDNVGPATFRELINHCGSAETALEMLPELSRRGGARRGIRVAGLDEAEREMDAARRHGAAFVGIGEPDYPPFLRLIHGAPPLLAVKGDRGVATAPAVGVVGARNASIAGMKFAGLISRDIGRGGFVIVSGLARGIDAAAHRASLSTGTIAAMAGGLDRPYPPENIALLEEMVDGPGLAISEMPFGWEPRARDFPRRNRLIAGIALGLVVIEAAARSGSLITARNAADFGRLVFAVPGSPLDPRSEGTNNLLKDGATITTRPEDVLESLRPLCEPDLFGAPAQADEPPENETPALSLPPSDNERERIAGGLGPVPTEIDDIIRETEIAAATVYLVLLELDLAGRLNRHPGGRVSLAPD
ncbi:DNA-processing protein DprA [Shinella daejeonensis]|uniref:DNA-processing protein DprA n=1 Tax=Shinella daejeonensis TaxID=659017 RepID=UPI0020C758DB|nr:DNA-processing protein DprA [Shinella daejeonensis]MCP8895556.1 DNA-processing protein DprA [Shinella daejeonensis]